MLDVVDFIKERGGDPEKIRESQRRRHASVEIVDEIIALFEDHRKSASASPRPLSRCHSRLTSVLLRAI
jgi:seryl-tRNA synthetase